VGIVVLAGIASGQEINPDKRLEHATVAIRAFFSSESNIPKDLAGKAQCVVVAPHLAKGAFLIGDKYGRGFASCRRVNGGWSAPAAIAIEGGPQLSASSTDLIMLVMNQTGMTRLSGDKFTLGGEVTIVAGPTGVSANVANAEMISYARDKGSFAGITLEGATLRPDPGENKKLYGHETENSQILAGRLSPPRGAKTFVAVLNKHARKGK